MAEEKKYTQYNFNDDKLDVVRQAKKKREFLFSFYDNINKGRDILSAEDLDLAIESFKLAQLDIKEREKREREEKEAKLLKKKLEKQQKRRELALVRARERAERERKARVEQITAMDLPMDFENSFDNDSRATGIKCDSISDGLVFSLDALGIVDIEFISSVTGEDMKKIIETLRGSIFQNPLHWKECFYKGWETADEYLSGNLSHKYELAKQANEQYMGYFEANVKALEEVMNGEIDIKDIYVTLGSPWVPADIIDDFIFHLVDMDPVDGQYPKAAEPFMDSEFSVKREEETGIWEIPRKNRFRNCKDHGKYEQINYSIYGTNRMDMLTLLENILNMKTLVIHDVIDKEKNTRILNQNETVKVLEKQEKLISEFQNWVWNDETRKRRLQGAYCRRYGNIKKRNFDGSFLNFPNMNEVVELRPHQKNSVARILFSPNTLLAHDVGAGKTFTMIAAGMELRRLGKSQKNLYVIPNNILPQWAEMFRYLYPQSKFLVVDRKNFNIEKRNETLKKITDEDFDAILMAYSCFDMLSLSKKYYKEFYEEQKNKIEKANEKFASKAHLSKRRIAIEKTLKKLQEDTAANVCEIPFDELGINTLFVDEAHNYKNVSIQSGITRVKGISGTGSLKCDGLMDKVHCVQRQNNGGRVIMATGTPITNSITDLFVLQKYLQDGELEFMGIQNFDSWVAMFGRKTTEFEIDVDTNSYHLATRFSRFYNVPELTAILSSVADFYHVDQSMGLPDFDGYTDSVRQGGEDFKIFLQDISKRADDVRRQRVEPKIDNLLKITTDGRKAALDMRLIDMIYGLEIDSKVFRCAENVMEIYSESRDKKLIQMVFCDVSTPKAGFNLYDELKRLLIAMGMPEHEIAFIHEADTAIKKKILFKELEKGNIAVVVGSTFKMGLGVNVQKRLCALHHLDVPWRPADMVQREGRILRQGNECDSVKIFRYITRGSFDAYSWQLLESKQRFISQILSGTVSQRDGDDVDEAVLNYAEVKALAVGNPLIKRRVELSNQLDKYNILHYEFVENREKQKRELVTLDRQIAEEKTRIENITADIEYYTENKVDYKGMSYEEQKNIRTLIYNAAKTKANYPIETPILEYQGFEVYVPAYMNPKTQTAEDGETVKKRIPYVCLRRNGIYYMDVESDSGITRRLNFLLDNLGSTKTKYEQYLQNLCYRKQSLEEENDVTENNYIDEIAKIKAEIEEINEKLGVSA